MADVGKIKTVYSLGQRPRKQNLLLFMLAKCFLRSAHTHYERSQSTLLLNCKVVCESHARDFECLAGLCCCNRHRGLVASQRTFVCHGSGGWEVRDPGAESCWGHSLACTWPPSCSVLTWQSACWPFFLLGGRQSRLGSLAFVTLLSLPPKGPTSEYCHVGR